MSDPPVPAPKPPPPAARGKQVAEESEGGSGSSWPGDESSGDEAGSVAGARTVLPEAEGEDEDDVPLVWRPRAPAAAATSAMAAGASVASAATGVVAPPRGSAVLPKRGIFNGYSLKLNPQGKLTSFLPLYFQIRACLDSIASSLTPCRDSALDGAGKRGRTDAAPAAPSKKPRTRASVSARQANTQASGAATTPAADPVPKEEEPAAVTDPSPDSIAKSGATDSPTAEAGTAGDKSTPASAAALQGPNGPATGADDTVIDLTSDVEDAELRDEPEAAPAPSPAAPDTMVVAPTTATGVGLDGASPAQQAGGADPAAAQQEATPAGGMGPSPDPQPAGAGVEEDAAGGQQAAPLQGDDAPPSQTRATGVSPSSVATSSPDLSVLAEATWDPITWDPSISIRGTSSSTPSEQQLAFVTSFKR
ncbi:mucin-1-like [Brachypodium distachyon]|uniref:mucin-1-like n=1 Tax=Brachypodium distachyon TaxID=15368 RepID=UPI00053000A1|nr:mucin-1-like [Brachypodium distachyon]|eukprot:XP_010230126.1 mucin-1-like [Brachypodium distachyon]